MAKGVIMPLRVFHALFRLMYADSQSMEDKRIVTDWIEAKVGALSRHEQYSMWKDKTLTDDERENARKRYMEQAGIQEDFFFGDK